MMFDAVLFLIQFALETAFLFLALWIMIKIQKLQYNFLGLIGTAALGAGCDMIPWVGHYVAVPVLYICLLKMTQSEFIDVVFTVMISYALTFCMNLFLLGALMEDLRPSAAVEYDRKRAPKPKYKHEESARRPAVVPAAKTNKPPELSATNAARAKTNVLVAVPKTVRQVAEAFSFRGVSNSSNSPVALIHTGVASYSISLGQSIEMTTEIGKLKVQCYALERDRVLLEVAGEPVILVFGPTPNGGEE